MGEGLRPPSAVDDGYVHAAADDHSRLVYAEALPGHDGTRCAALWRRAARLFADHGIAVERVMTDKAFEYVRSRDVAQALTQTGVRRSVPATTLPATMTVRQTSKLLGVSSRAYRAIEAGQISLIRVARRIYVPTHKLHAMLGIPSTR